MKMVTFLQILTLLLVDGLLKIYTAYGFRELEMPLNHSSEIVARQCTQRFIKYLEKGIIITK
jgi:hypothetical protein